MSNAISGFLKQKKESPYGVPAAGDIRRFTVERTEKRNKPGEFYNSLKNQGDGFGSEYKVLKADASEYSDDHGNVAFSLLIEPTGAPAQNGSAPTGSSGGEVSGGDRQNSIEAQAAAKSAARYLQGREASPDQINTATVAFFTAIQNAKEMGEPDTPSADPKAEAEPSGSPTNAADPSDDIPFGPSLI